MGDQDILDLARNNRDRLFAEVEQLRDRLTTAAAELSAIEAFLQRYEHFQSHLGPAPDPRPPVELPTIALPLEPVNATPNHAPAIEPDPALTPTPEPASIEPPAPELITPVDAPAATPAATPQRIITPVDIPAVPRPAPAETPAAAPPAQARRSPIGRLIAHAARPRSNRPSPDADELPVAGEPDEPEEPPVPASAPPRSKTAETPPTPPPPEARRSPIERLVAQTARPRDNWPSPGASPLPATSEPPFEACFVVEETHGARRIAVPPAPLTIGSEATCDLVLPSSYGVAPRHAVATLLENGGILLRVIEAGAPASVNGQRITWATLEHDDLVSLGAFTLRVSIAPTTPRAATDPESHDARQAG